MKNLRHDFAEDRSSRFGEDSCVEGSDVGSSREAGAWKLKVRLAARTIHACPTQATNKYLANIVKIPRSSAHEPTKAPPTVNLPRVEHR